jgi:hypothetical protein
MPLDWSRGFGTSNSGSAPASASLRALAYIPLTTPPPPGITLLVDPRRFLCAQLPEIASSETQYIDILATNPNVSALILDLLAYERRFIRDLQFVSEQFAATMKSSKEYQLPREFSDFFAELVGRHAVFVDAIDRLAKSNPPDLIHRFIVLLLDLESLRDAHVNYMVRSQEVESDARAWSCAKSSSLVDVLEGSVLFQLFRAPMNWLLEMGRFSSQLLASLPDLDNPKLLHSIQKWGRSSKRIVEAVNSVPKLESIAKMTEQCKFTIVVPERRFIQEGQAKKLCRKKADDRVLFLFSDLFIYAKKRSGRLHDLVDYSLLQFRVGMPDESAQCLAIYGLKKSCVLEFSSNAVANEWRTLLERTVDEAWKDTGEEKREDWEPAPIWIPDQTTKCCMNPQCKVKFTMVNRRHHCRRCGNIFCAKCLPKKVLLPGISDKPALCCTVCYRQRKTQ